MNINDYSLWTAIVTPFDDEGNVDLISLSALVSQQSKAQNGLLILGSTGEALNLNLEKKKQIIEHVLNLKTSVPIMVGVGGHLLEECLSWVKYLESKSIHAYLMVTPIYSKPGPEGQYNWFKSLMDAVSRPVMLYNVPGRTGIALDLSAVKRLKNHKNFWAIKEASGSVEKFKEYLSAAGKNVFCGDDALMPDFAIAGSCGLVSVASNAWPYETHHYVKQCLEKTFDAKELWVRAANSLFIASNPIPVKRLLFEQGMIKTPKMMAPLSEKDLQDVSAILKSNNEIERWYQGEI